MWNSAPLLAAIAWWSLVLTAVFGGVAVVTGFVAGVAATRASDITSTEAAANIARANEGAEVARREAARANAEAARANERLHKAQEMRRLTGNQTSALEPLLRSELFQSDPKPVLRVSAVDDAEAQMYAMDFQRFFEACGVNIYPTKGGLPNECVQLEPHATGLVLTVKTVDITIEGQPHARFQHAMHAIGLEATVEVDARLRPNEGVLHVLRKPAIT